MTLYEPEKLDLRSHDIVEDKKQELLGLFPEILTEGSKIDFKRLKLILGETVDVGKERYGMNWPGKADCFKTIQAPSMGTLLPFPEESVNFETTENLFIEGENLEVLKLLQKSYIGKIKMIYIDPPYNTGSDFIYPDNYTESLRTYLEYTGQLDSEGKKFSTNAETDGRYHSKWLNMMYPRLYLARNLLNEDGIMLISIDENEVKGLRTLCDEVFGEDCFIADLIWKKKSGGGGDVGQVVVDHEYILVYGKTTFATIFNDLEAEVTTSYNKSDSDGRRYSLDRLDKQSLGYQVSLDFPIKGPDGRIYRVIHKDPKHKVARWRWGKDTVDNRLDELVFQWPYVYTKNYEKDTGAKPRSLLVDERFGRTRTGKTDLAALFGEQVMDHPKPVKLMKHLIKICTRESDIILDFFAGSATLAQASLELLDSERAKCPFIMIQIPEPIPGDAPASRAGFSNIAQLGQERIRKVIKKLNDSEKGELSIHGNPDRGFKVFKLAESNFRTWNADVPPGGVEALQHQLDLHVHHVRDNRTAEDILYELLIKSGFPLTTPVEKLKWGEKTLYSAAGGAFLICLERELTLELLKEMAERMPERVVCLDVGFAGKDQLKVNAVQIFKSKGVKSFKTV